MVIEAFKELFPDREPLFTSEVRYSNKFKAFNANVKYSKKKVIFGLSSEWRGIEKEIIKGLIQSLFLRIYKTDKKTDSIELYDSFIKNLPAKAVETDSVLEDSFNRINKEFFAGLMDVPNLGWCRGTRTLGKYDFHQNKISISSLLHEKLELIDYVMYHEMLHKHCKYIKKNGRNIFHSSKFRRVEKSYPNSKTLEKELNMLVSSVSSVKTPLR